MKGSLAGLVLSMMATQSTIETIVDDAIKSLEEFKARDYKDDKSIFSDLSLVLLKIQQGERDEVEVMKEAMNAAVAVDEATKMVKAMEDDVIEEDAEGLDENIILTGPTGEA